MWRVSELKEAKSRAAQRLSRERPVHLSSDDRDRQWITLGQDLDPQVTGRIRISYFNFNFVVDKAIERSVGGWLSYYPKCGVPTSGIQNKLKQTIAKQIHGIIEQHIGNWENPAFRHHDDEYYDVQNLDDAVYLDLENVYDNGRKVLQALREGSLRQSARDLYQQFAEMLPDMFARYFQDLSVTEIAPIGNRLRDDAKLEDVVGAVAESYGWKAHQRGKIELDERSEIVVTSEWLLGRAGRPIVEFTTKIELPKQIPPPVFVLFSYLTDQAVQRTAADHLPEYDVKTRIDFAQGFYATNQIRGIIILPHSSRQTPIDYVAPMQGAIELVNSFNCLPLYRAFEEAAERAKLQNAALEQSAHETGA